MPAKENSDADILRSIASGEMRGFEFGREARTLVPSANTVGQSFFDQVFEKVNLLFVQLNNFFVIICLVAF